MHRGVLASFTGSARARHSKRTTAIRRGPRPLAFSEIRPSLIRAAANAQAHARGSGPQLSAFAAVAQHVSNFRNAQLGGEGLQEPACLKGLCAPWWKGGHPALPRGSAFGPCLLPLSPRIWRVSLPYGGTPPLPHRVSHPLLQGRTLSPQFRGAIFHCTARHTPIQTTRLGEPPRRMHAQCRVVNGSAPHNLRLRTSLLRQRKMSASR